MSCTLCISSFSELGDLEKLERRPEDLEMDLSRSD